MFLTKTLVKQLYILTLLTAFVLVGLVLFPATTHAACTSEIDLILRDPSGDITPGLRYEIYGQEQDANGKVIPSTRRVGGGTIGFNGIGSTRFSNTADSYAIKVYEKNSKVGEYWFFDALTVDCGDTAQVELKLSSVGFVLRDIEKKLLDTPSPFPHNF